MLDLTIIRSFPPEKPLSTREWDRQAQEFVKALASIAESFWTASFGKQNILDHLNPATHTLPYLFALGTQTPPIGFRTKTEEWLERVVLFLVSFDPVQVRYAGDAWKVLMDGAFQAFTELVIADLSPLSTAMLRLDPTAGTFTSYHLQFVRLCLVHGTPSRALPLLDKTIYAFPQAPAKYPLEELRNENRELSNGFITARSGFAGAVTSETVLEYYLLGAHIYIGLRNYARARLFLECVILMPSPHHVCSAFQVEAYRQWILLGLLAEGAQYPALRNLDPLISKSLRATSKPYQALAEDYEKRDWRKFQAELDVGYQIWTVDGNLQLVQEVGHALFRSRVADLQRVYAALPMHQVASILSMPASVAQQMIQNMIHGGYLSAAILPSAEHSDGVLRFHGTSNTGPAPAAQPGFDLENKTKRLEVLVGHIKEADRRLRLTKEFVDHHKKTKKLGTDLDGEWADHMDLSWEAPPEEGDEDLMAV